jgi:hypothetical protein
LSASLFAAAEGPVFFFSALSSVTLAASLETKWVYLAFYLNNIHLL